MSPDEVQTLVSWLLSESGELAVTARMIETAALSDARAETIAAKPYASAVQGILRKHTVGFVRRYATLVCSAVPASTVRDFEELFGGTFDEATNALDRLNDEIIRR